MQLGLRNTHKCPLLGSLTWGKQEFKVLFFHKVYMLCHNECHSDVGHTLIMLRHGSHICGVTPDSVTGPCMLCAVIIILGNAFCCYTCGIMILALLSSDTLGSILYGYTLYCYTNTHSRFFQIQISQANME